MAGTSLKKCPNCNTMNKNRDYCETCGTLINVQLQRELDRKKRIETKSEIPQKPNAITSFFDKAINHPTLAVRIIAKFFYSIWAIVISIGTLLAFLFSYVAA